MHVFQGHVRTVSSAYDPTLDRVKAVASSAAGDLLLLATKHKGLVSITLTEKHEENEKSKDDPTADEEAFSRLVPDVRTIAWPPLHGTQVNSPTRCLALSPGEDFVAVATSSGDVYVVSTRVVAPSFVPRGKQRRDSFPTNVSMCADKDCNSRSWSESSYVHFPPAKDLPFRVANTASDGQHSGQNGTEENKGDDESDDKRLEPASILWWTTQDFGSLAYIGTSTGELLCMDLVSGSEVSQLAFFTIVRKPRKPVRDARATETRQIWRCGKRAGPTRRRRTCFPTLARVAERIRRGKRGIERGYRRLANEAWPLTRHAFFHRFRWAWSQSFPWDTPWTSWRW